MKRRRRTLLDCACHSGRPYKSCCKPYHLAQALPQTPQALMRSRYAAYAKGKTDYILETTDPQGPLFQEDRALWRAGVREFSESTDFLGLTILEAESEGDRGRVRFHAQLRQGEQDASFEENSAFARRQGRWTYVGPIGALASDPTDEVP